MTTVMKSSATYLNLIEELAGARRRRRPTDPRDDGRGGGRELGRERTALEDSIDDV